MSKIESIYQIRVPNEKSVMVTLWSSNGEFAGGATGTLRQDKLKPVQDDLTDSSRLTGESIKRVGEALFECLFDNELRNNFLQAYQDIVVDRRQWLQVRLEINETALPELIAHPWELMRVPQCYREGEIRLATDGHLSLVRCRYNRDNQPRIILGNNDPLKIALVVARPTANSKLSNVKSHEVEHHLNGLAAHHQEKIEFLPVINPATSQKLADQLRDEKPDIFHFIGHGQLISKNGKEVGQVAFVKDSFEADWKDAQDFSQLFAHHRPKIVILQACDTARESEMDAFSSVASALMLQGIPVVIAMQYKVSNQTAVKFVKDFYDQIVKGDPVNIAVQQARFNLANQPGYKNLDFAIPVIYMNAVDRNLWKRLTDEQKKRLCKEIEDFYSEEDKLKSLFRQNKEKFRKFSYNCITGGDYQTRVINLIPELENRDYLSSFIAVVREEYSKFAQDILG